MLRFSAVVSLCFQLVALRLLFYSSADDFLGLSRLNYALLFGSDAPPARSLNQASTNNGSKYSQSMLVQPFRPGRGALSRGGLKPVTHLRCGFCGAELASVTKQPEAVRSLVYGPEAVVRKVQFEVHASLVGLERPISEQEEPLERAIRLQASQPMVVVDVPFPGQESATLHILPVLTCPGVFEVDAFVPPKEPSSWFDGYRWRAAGCVNCQRRVGWTYEASNEHGIKSFCGLAMPWVSAPVAGLRQNE